LGGATLADDLFIKRKCISYAAGLLRFNPQPTHSFLEYVFKVDKSMISVMRSFFELQLREDSLYDFRKDFLDQDDADDFARLAIMTLRDSGNRLKAKFKAIILEHLAQASSLEPTHSPPPLEQNLFNSQRLFHLTDEERELFLFSYLMQTCAPVEGLFYQHLSCELLKGRRFLAAALGLSFSAINRALSGNLVRAGLLNTTMGRMEIENDFIGLLHNPGQNLTSKLFRPSPRTSLPLDYHLIEEASTRHLCRLLAEKSACPTHVLLYGPPGTGKTSYARGLARKLGLPSYEIGVNEENQGHQRRAGIIACLNATNLNGQGSIVIVDEADSLLNTRDSWSGSGEVRDKGWLNRFLEEPEARIIWIANRIDEIEDSVMRRFAFSVQFRHFSRAQRARLWQQVLRRHGVKRRLPEQAVADMAKRFKVSPGMMDLAVQKAKASAGTGTSEFRDAVVLALEAHLTLAHGGRHSGEDDSVEETYSLEGLNADRDLEELTRQMEACDRALRSASPGKELGLNTLFYGPPGTGKSELARHLADRLDRELMVRRASDLLDPYVGMTERRIRDAFAEAESEQALLVVDEADSFLYTRGMAQHSWEMSFVNEFLTQMERFRGLLICTTNNLPGLDEASIRRFPVKVGFDFLAPAGNLVFYNRLLAPMVGRPLDPASRACLESLGSLAPGDFKIVREVHRFRPSGELAHDDLIKALAKEAELKRSRGGGKIMGFGA
jgi:AAA+ superfamily predicted ATPase